MQILLGNWEMLFWVDCCVPSFTFSLFACSYLIPLSTYICYIGKDDDCSSSEHIAALRVLFESQFYISWI